LQYNHKYSKKTTYTLKTATLAFAIKTNHNVGEKRKRLTFTY